MDKKMRVAQAALRLTDWYLEHARALPWRENPSPYRIWISEIMLQQTRIEAVKPYFERFLAALPDVRALAEASEETVLKLWEGLGYYSRARNLQKAARLCVEKYGGELPRSYQELLTLPGIGNYTAGAIASIAWKERVPAVDGNVLRVLARLCADGEDITRQAVKRGAEDLLTACLPEENPGSFNEGIMELGETICLPNGAPLCMLCPLRELCLAFEQGDVEKYPVKAAKKPRRIENRTVFLIEVGRNVAIRKRPDTGLLAGLYELPSREGHLTAGEVRAWLAEQKAAVAAVEILKKAKHIFSHVEWHMVGYRIQLEEELAGDWIYVPREEVREVYPLPTALKAYAEYWNS